MFSAICIFLVWIIVIAFQRAGNVVFPRAPIKDEELQTYFSTNGRNLSQLMTDIAKGAARLFGNKPLTSFIRFNLCLYVFFVAALGWLLSSVAGYDLLFHFVASGFQIHLDPNERDYLLDNLPLVSQDMRNDGAALYVGPAVFDASVLFGVIAIALSASSWISFYTNLSLIRWLASNVRKGWCATLLRMIGALLVGFAADLTSLVLLVWLIAVGGGMLGLFVAESFTVRSADNAIKYGIEIGVGTPVSDRHGRIVLGYGLWIGGGLDFDQLSRDANASKWVEWLMPAAVFYGDALELCERHEVRPVCRDRLRALYFQALNERSKSTLLEVFGMFFLHANKLACGRNYWEAFHLGTGASEGTKLLLPFVGATAALVVSKMLIIPVLILISLSDYVLIRLGRYVARSSEKGFSIIALHGAALLTAPPFIALALLGWVLRWSCG
jgi:hypothetical protein